jgi:hypothetical protein
MYKVKYKDNTYTTIKNVFSTLGVSTLTYYQFGFHARFFTMTDNNKILLVFFLSGLKVFTITYGF